ncbi:hypothetical protein SDC9_174675 [bioreactor metagenome]|uniref:Uncharacterized protein n=1 Tax=bioreactor metagenome TaxID=1076179 RepID=A0A645GK20_9ZZZZ
MSLFYGFTTLAGSAAIAQALSSTFTPLAAYAFVVFVLLYIPCIAAMAAIRREMNSAKWAWGALAWQLIVAYAVSLLIYQGGLLLGLG